MWAKSRAEDYAEDVRHTEMFLSGRNADLVSELADAMDRAAAALQFEKAAQCRDQIQLLQQMQARQYIEGESGDLDIVVCHLQASLACVQVLYVRDGRILGSRSYFPSSHLDEDVADVLEAFIAAALSERAWQPRYSGRIARECGVAE